MKRNEVEILIMKYLNSEITPNEEMMLAIEVSRDNVPQEWKVIAEMLGELAIDEALYDNMMAGRSKKSRIIKLWPWVAAACVAVMLVVFLAPPKREVPPVVKIEVAKTNQTEFAKTNQSEVAITNQTEFIKQQEMNIIQGVSAVGQKVKALPSTSLNDKTLNENSANKHNAVAVNSAKKHNAVAVTKENEALLAEANSELMSTTPSSEFIRATADIFDATLANVRRAALEKMMSCDIQCMDEDINLRANHLSTLIYEQSQ